MNLRIAFGCQARVGKNEAVHYLVNEYGGKELSFAEPLYNMLYFSQKECGFELKKDRKFLQWVGTEWGREQDPDVWVKCLKRKLKDIPPNGNVYISDLRFPNEFKMLKEEGFTCVRIIRSSLDSEESNSKSWKMHTSECSLKSLPFEKWDRIVYNDSTLEDLHSKIKNIVEFKES